MKIQNYGQGNSLHGSNSFFPIPLALQPVCVDIFWKFLLFDQILKYQRSTTSGWKDIQIYSARCVTIYLRCHCQVPQFHGIFISMIPTTPLYIFLNKTPLNSVYDVKMVSPCCDPPPQVLLHELQAPNLHFNPWQGPSQSSKVLGCPTSFSQYLSRTETWEMYQRWFLVKIGLFDLCSAKVMITTLFKYLRRLSFLELII